LSALLTDESSNQDHDEILEVLEGRMIFYLDGKELVTSAGDPPILIRRGHIHGFTVSSYCPILLASFPAG
jgi:ethanolamine utilization protein EutQ (cupin superfamily)